MVRLLALNLYQKTNLTKNYAAILQYLCERALTLRFSSLILTYLLQIAVISSTSSLKIKTLGMFAMGILTVRRLLLR